MTVGDNVAWVTFNQNDNGRMTKEQRVMKKVNGKWKICDMTAVNVTSFGIGLAEKDD
jgi:hypothetical protein